MFLWGFSGSGETGIAMETVKIKVSHCKEKNKSVRVIVTANGWRYNRQLLIYLEEYLKNIDVQIVPLNHLCDDLFIHFDISQPKKMINAVIRSLSELSCETDQLTIFVCDEVEPCRNDG